MCQSRDETTGAVMITNAISDSSMSKLSENLVHERHQNVLDRYEIMETIGHGSISFVYLVRRKKQLPKEDLKSALAVPWNDKTVESNSNVSQPPVLSNCNGKVIHSDQLFALKQIDLILCQPELQETMRNEINLLRSLFHPNIVKIYEVYHDTNKNLSIIMEHCAGGDLNSRLPYTEQQAADILKQILEAVHYLHSSSHIVHRDLKCKRNSSLSVIDSRLPLKCKLFKI
jgi:serine/threonine protein kinase